MHARTIASIVVPTGVEPEQVAAQAIEVGAFVWPVVRVDGSYQPVAAYAGPSRSPWGLATRDAKRFGELMRQHPEATVGLRVPTEHGFDRHYALVGEAFIEIPADVIRVGRL